MKSKKQTLLTSGLCLGLSAALLAGTTFAWFTDSVTNKGNTIQAGTLDIALNGTSTTPLFSSDNNFLWEPGRSQKATATITNTGSLWLKYTMSFANVEITGGDNDPDADITKVLDVYLVKDGATNLVGATKLGTMAELMEKGSFAAKDAVLAPDGEAGLVNNKPVDDTDTFNLVIQMQEEASNKYQDCGVTFDVLVNATQFTYETDGFGSNEYDQNAQYDAVTVGNEAELLQAVQAGKSVALGQDIQVTKNVEFSKDASLALNGHTLTVDNGTGSVKALTGATLTVHGSGTLKGALYADRSATLVVNGDENFQVYSDSSMGWAVYGGTGSVVEIDGGTYTATQEGAVIHQNSMFCGSLTMKGATVNVESNSVMDSYGISANSSEIYLEDVAVNAKYSRAFYCNSSSKIVILGGSYVTDQVAEGWNPNPTIQFSGTLDISDASILRVGYGIKKGYGATLTSQNVTFQTNEHTVGGYTDIG